MDINGGTSISFRPLARQLSINWWRPSHSSAKEFKSGMDFACPFIIPIQMSRTTAKLSNLNPAIHVVPAAVINPTRLIIKPRKEPQNNPPTTCVKAAAAMMRGWIPP